MGRRSVCVVDYDEKGRHLEVNTFEETGRIRVQLRFSGGVCDFWMSDYEELDKIIETFTLVATLAKGRL